MRGGASSASSSHDNQLLRRTSCESSTHTLCGMAGRPGGRSRLRGGGPRLLLLLDPGGVWRPFGRPPCAAGSEPAAALGATVLAGQVANLPVLALVLPRALELVGIAYLVAAVNKYGSDPDAEIKDDLAAAAKRGGDAVKKLTGK